MSPRSSDSADKKLAVCNMRLQVASLTVENTTISLSKWQRACERLRTSDGQLQTSSASSDGTVAGSLCHIYDAFRTRLQPSTSH